MRKSNSQKYAGPRTRDVTEKSLGGGQGRRGYGYCRGLSLGCANVCGSKEGVNERDPKLNIMTSLLSKIF